ncbi:unnamed protein product [Rhizoctonia solani]|nr:unnamed protein product [Rhizoctonia solani]
MRQPGSSKSGRALIVHEGHDSAVQSVAFAPDGKLVASGSQDSTIRIWDAQSTFPIGSPFQGHNSPWGIKTIAYSHLNDMLASGAGDSTVCLWNPSTGQQIGQPLEGHEDGVNAVVFSPRANIVASGSNDKTIRLWDTRNATLAFGPYAGHTDRVNSVAFSPDGTRIVSGSGDQTFRVWDTERGSTIIIGQGHTWGVNSVSFSPDGSQIVTGSHDGTVRLWDVRSGTAIGKPYEGHDWWVSSVAFSPDGTWFASGSGDSTVRIWDKRSGNLAAEPFEGHTNWVYSVAFSPCGTRIVSGGNDDKVLIWSILEDDSDSDRDGVVTLEPKRRGSESPMGLIASHMSIQDMFDRLLHHGCVDLSPQMDVGQETAVILAGGGFGDIWKGEMHDGTMVAIKAWRSSIIEQSDYKTLKRATREIYYWSRMKHENIHELMGVIMFKGRYLGMVSQWMRNGNLHEYIRKNPRVDRYQMSIQVASGLAYMHQGKTVHGDLKAINVLVSSEGIAKLSDFDFSIMSEASLVFSETSNARAGSTRWAAPEFFLEPPSGRSKSSDVYALGMTILVRRLRASILGANQ